MNDNPVIHGDALEIVRDLGEFDYCLTDPPYPIGGKSSFTSTNSVASARSMVDSMAQSFIFAVLKNIQRSEGFSIWLMCDWRQVSYYSNILIGLGLPNQNCIVWDKVTGVMSSRYHARHELILFASGKKNLGGGFWGTDVVLQPRPPQASKSHAFEKPPELVEKMCKAFEPGRVLDPFCGTGGLLVGAKKLGWDVVGIDVELDFVNVANQRLKQTKAGVLPPTPEQTKLI